MSYHVSVVSCHVMSCDVISDMLCLSFVVLCYVRTYVCMRVCAYVHICIVSGRHSVCIIIENISVNT